MYHQHVAVRTWNSESGKHCSVNDSTNVATV